MAPAVPNGVQFHVFRAKKNSSAFVVTAGADPNEIHALAAHAGTWEPFKILPEVGKPRIGFSEADAKADIQAKGYHLVGIKVSVSEKN